jgi:integrase
MPSNRRGRRPHGSGALIEQGGIYYGKWRVAGRQIKRKLGAVRKPTTREGLTKAQAEQQLRRLMAETAAPPPAERLTVAETAGRLLTHLQTMGRKPSTLRSYRALLRAQIEPRLGQRPVAQLTQGDVERFMAVELSAGLKPKTIANALGFLNHLVEYAVKRGWASSNPCRHVERPRSLEPDTALRFLDQAEVEAVLRAVPPGDFGRVQRVLYLAAAMSGLRQGELLALQWQDVDWQAQRIRVRRNYVRGQFGTPKSQRGSRSVPLADRLGGELDRLHRSTAYGGDDDLVFGPPTAGDL